MSEVRLGNVNPADPGVNENAVTLFRVPEGTRLTEAVASITRAYDQYHSDDPPEWVESDSAVLAQAIAEHYTYGDGERERVVLDGDRQPTEDTVELPAHECVVGRPTDWTGLEDEPEADES